MPLTGGFVEGNYITGVDLRDGDTGEGLIPTISSVSVVLFSNPQNNMTKLTADQLGNVRKGIAGLSNQCTKFLEALFKQLGRSYKKTIMGVFNEVAKKGGLVDSSSSNPDAAGYTVVGADARNPRIELDLAGIAATSDSNPQALLFLVVHELVHANMKRGRYTHTQMAVAANTVGRKMGLSDFLKSPKDFPWMGTDVEQVAVDNFNVALFDQRLAHFCFPKR